MLQENILVLKESVAKLYKTTKGQGLNLEREIKSFEDLIDHQLYRLFLASKFFNEQKLDRNGFKIIIESLYGRISYDDALKVSHQLRTVNIEEKFIATLMSGPNSNDIDQAARKLENLIEKTYVESDAYIVGTAFYCERLSHLTGLHSFMLKGMKNYYDITTRGMNDWNSVLEVNQYIIKRIKALVSQELYTKMETTHEGTQSVYDHYLGITKGKTYYQHDQPKS